MRSRARHRSWRREKKVALIEDRNPTWEDLAEGWGEAAVMMVSGKAASLRSAQGRISAELGPGSE